MYLRRILFVDEVGIENVELVTLNNFRRWVIVIVVSLIVFVPLESSVDAIEVSVDR